MVRKKRDKLVTREHWESMTNLTENVTTTSKTRGEIWVYWEIWSILILLGILIIIGNSLVCSIFVIWRQLRNPTNTFLVMLAIADLLIGVVFIPLYIGGHYLEYYHLVSVTENLDLVLKLTFFASVFNLYAVTADRYIAVLHALRYNALMTTRTVTLIALAAWLCPALLIVVLLICKFVAPDMVSYVLFAMEIAFVIIPGILMAFAYSKIFMEAKKQIKQVASLQVYDASQEREKAKQRKAEHKVAKVRDLHFQSAAVEIFFILIVANTCFSQ